jgi:hypothetical protein
MAVNEGERRTPRDYIRDTRMRYAGEGTPWVGIIIGFLLAAAILYMLVTAMGGPRTTSDAVRETPPNPQTSTAPKITTPTPTAPTIQPK